MPEDKDIRNQSQAPSEDAGLQEDAARKSCAEGAEGAGQEAQAQANAQGGAGAGAGAGFDPGNMGGFGGGFNPGNMGGNSGPSNDGTVDADYEVVDEE